MTKRTSSCQPTPLMRQTSMHTTLLRTPGHTHRRAILHLFPTAKLAAAASYPRHPTLRGLAHRFEATRSSIATSGRRHRPGPLRSTVTCRPLPNPSAVMLNVCRSQGTVGLGLRSPPLQRDLTSSPFVPHYALSGTQPYPGADNVRQTRRGDGDDDAVSSVADTESSEITATSLESLTSVE